MQCGLCRRRGRAARAVLWGYWRDRLGAPVSRCHARMASCDARGASKLTGVTFSELHACMPIIPGLFRAIAVLAASGRCSWQLQRSLTQLPAGRGFDAGCSSQGLVCAVATAGHRRGAVSRRPRVEPSNAPCPAACDAFPYAHSNLLGAHAPPPPQRSDPRLLQAAYCLV